MKSTATRVGRPSKERTPPDGLTGVKWCPRCESWKEFRAFGKNVSRPDGYSIYCKECRRRYEKDRGTRYRDLRNSVLDLYGHKCIHCGESRRPCLDLDHIDEELAKKERAAGMSSFSRVKGILDGSLNQFDYQILCANCNRLKREKRRGYNTP